jgi:hypothetical protein
MTEFYKEKINDPRLTPSLQHTRSGRAQEFREKGTSYHDEPLVCLTHEKPEMYAELIDGAWYWVNGCAYCDDAHPSQKGKSWSYCLCDKHNVCGHCGQHRSVFKDSVWGRSDMAFCCQSCQQIEDDAEKHSALANTLEDYPELDKDHHHWHEDNIKCPYCLAEIEDDGGSYADGESECQCPICGEDFTVTADIRIEYTTTPKRPKADVYREAGLLSEDDTDDIECKDNTSHTDKSVDTSQSVTDALPDSNEYTNVLNAAIETENKSNQ